MASQTGATLFSRQQIALLFLLALAIRLSYIAAVVLFDGLINNGSDSGKYLLRASNLLEHGSLVYLHYGELIPDTGRMPVYSYFVAGVMKVFGQDSLWPISVAQAFIDASTVLVIGIMTGAMRPGWAVPAAAITCVWASLVVYTSFVLADTLFIALFCWGLCACIWSVRSRHQVLMLLAAGLFLSLAMLTRPTLMFFPYLLWPALAYLLWSGGRVKGLRAISLAAIPAVMIILSVVPRIAENHANYGVPILTSQSGNHALDVVDQFMRICPQCILEGREDLMHADVRTRLAQLDPDERRNPISVDDVRREIALEYLKDLPLSALVRGTTLAVIRSVVQTALYETGHQFQLNPKFLSAVSGDSLGAKLSALARNIASDGFLLTWAVAQTFALIAVILQITGAIAGLSRRDLRPYTVFLLTVGAYFLAINGPFGNPRYAMPLTPVMIVLTTLGLMVVLEGLANLRRGRERRHGEAAQ